MGVLTKRYDFVARSFVLSFLVFSLSAPIYSQIAPAGRVISTHAPGAVNTPGADASRADTSRADTLAAVRIFVDASRVMNTINAGVYGSCIEDVNHEIYGGLYDQRLFGESFEEPPVKAGGVSPMWELVQSGAEGSLLMIDSTDAYNGSRSQSIVHGKVPGKIGIANKGLNHWGIAVKKGQSFAGRLYLRFQQPEGAEDGAEVKALAGAGSVSGGKAISGAKTNTGPVTVALESADGSKTYASQRIGALTSRWKKYSFRLTANSTDPRSRLVLYLENPGKLGVDQAVLMSTGSDRLKGLPVRADIATRMQEEGLNFVRYGGSMVNASGYRWKKMIGDPDKRPPYNGTWYPYSSNGFGIEDFLAFCEAAHFEAAFAVNIEETDQDAADLAEYLKGAITTTWGKKRADNGHPEPYKVQYIEIGNEEVIDSDNVDEYAHYIARFNGIYEAIHSKYPGIKLINAAWWRSQSPNMERVFKALDGKAAYWDLHVEADSAQSGQTTDKRIAKMQGLFLKWNPDTKMKCTIFEENGGLHNLQRALGHATTLNAVRRHGDFLLTSCAANGLQALGQNDNGWDQGQVFFTPSQVWGMPPFYAQQMAAENHVPLRVMDSITDNPHRLLKQGSAGISGAMGELGAAGDLDVTATRSKDGKTLVLHVVNTGETPIKTSLLLKGFPGRKPVIKIWTLAGARGAENTPEHPEAVATKKSILTLPGGSGAKSTGRSGEGIDDGCEFSLPATSYTILRFERF